MNEYIKNFLRVISNAYYYRILYIVLWTIPGFILFLISAPISQAVFYFTLMYMLSIMLVLMISKVIKNLKKLESNTIQKVLIFTSITFIAPFPGVISSFAAKDLNASASQQAMHISYSLSILIVLSIIGILYMFFTEDIRFKENSLYKFINSSVKDSVSTISRVTFIALCLSLSFSPLAAVLSKYGILFSMENFEFNYGRISLFMAFLMIPLVLIFILYPILVRTVLSNKKYLKIFGYLSPYTILLLCFFAPSILAPLLIQDNTSIDTVQAEISQFNSVYCIFLYLVLSVMIYMLGKVRDTEKSQYLAESTNE